MVGGIVLETAGNDIWERIEDMYDQIGQISVAQGHF
jgi:hypothetical protein